MKTSKLFKAKRKQDTNESAEDYTELIHELIEKKGEARIKDISEHFGISHVTAIKTLKRLADRKLIIKENHQPITLTKSGLKLAVESKNKHELIVKFLLKLGVSQETAELDAEGIEHHISDETLEKIAKSL